MKKQRPNQRDSQDTHAVLRSKDTGGSDSQGHTIFLARSLALNETKFVSFPETIMYSIITKNTFHDENAQIIQSDSAKIRRFSLCVSFHSRYHKHLSSASQHLEATKPFLSRTPKNISSPPNSRETTPAQRTELFNVWCQKATDNSVTPHHP